VTSPRALLLVVALLSIASDLAASPCCVSATNGGIGRLKPWELGAASVSQSLFVGHGRWDEAGDYARYQGFAEREWRTALTGMYALHWRTLLYAAFPVVILERSSGELSGTGMGIGDAKLGARHQLIDFGEQPPLPALGLYAGVTLPSGRAADEAEATLASDTTGRGAWVPELGFELEQVWGVWFVRLTGLGTLPIASTRADGQTQRFGPGIAGGLFAGRSFLQDRLVLSVSSRLAVEGEIHVDGDPVPESGFIDPGVGAQFSLGLGEHVTLVADLDAGVFIDGLGRNAPGRMGGGVGARYGFF
jgi:hypothetical protein